MPPPAKSPDNGHLCESTQHRHAANQRVHSWNHTQRNWKVKYNWAKRSLTMLTIPPKSTPLTIVIGKHIAKQSNPQPSIFSYQINTSSHFVGQEAAGSIKPALPRLKTDLCIWSPGWRSVLKSPQLASHTSQNRLRPD